MGERMSRQFPHLPERLVSAALSEWYYPRAVPTGPMPERFQRVMAAVDADRLATLVGSDTQDAAAVGDAERHPNEQPGARMSPAQQQLVVAALQDLKSWVESADGVGAVVEEIGRRTRWAHVGPNVSAVLREFADRAREFSRSRRVPAQTDADPDRVDVGAEALGAKLAALEMPIELPMEWLRDLARAVLEAAQDEGRESAMVQEYRTGAEQVVRRDVVVNRMPNRVELLDSAFPASQPPGFGERRNARWSPVIDTPEGWGDRG